LTLHADYVLMFAGDEGEALATISEIVARFDIFRGHVMKLVQALGRKGYLETIRGNKGGIRLARKPAQINIGAVVRDMEETLDIVGCLEREGYCCIETCCVLDKRAHRSRSASTRPFGRSVCQSWPVARRWSKADSNRWSHLRRQLSEHTSE
jgi:Rrf2 family nitric oxide-sensitive transcriptional repressor